jgi:hypothetical protein
MLNEAFRQTLELEVVQLAVGSSIRLQKMRNGIVEEPAPSQAEEEIATRL